MYAYAHPAATVRSDVDAIPAPSEPPRSEAGLRADAVREEAEGCKRSMAHPSNVALPRTLAWAARLPLDVQPHELVRSFARIANVLAASWDDPDAARAYFDALLIGRRLNRTGFPPNAINELLALHRHYVALHPENPPVYYRHRAVRHAHRSVRTGKRVRE